MSGKLILRIDVFLFFGIGVVIRRFGDILFRFRTSRE